MADLHAGASHQLRGRLAMAQFDRGIVPQHGLEEVVLPTEIKEKLKQIVNYSKAQAVLFGQWGFGGERAKESESGIAALFHGPSGTGKTLAAEAIGRDLGQSLKIVSCSQLISERAGESVTGIASAFDEAEASFMLAAHRLWRWRGARMCWRCIPRASGASMNFPTSRCRTATPIGSAIAAR